MTRSLAAVEGVRKAIDFRSIEHQPALILDYIEGQTLRECIEKNTFNLRSKLEIATDLARILGEIHQLNVLHLDLNGNNILIGAKRQKAHIIDLGAASRIEGDGYHKIRPDQMLGTLPYISPEQTGRINRAVDERSDLYSLGVVLYELMSGQLPFDSETPAELIRQHITWIPTSPSGVSPETPEMVSAIILKLLEKNAEDRYQSAIGVQKDLQECLRRLNPDNTIEEFPLGATDDTSRFKYPQQIYGRDGELKELLSAFASASQDVSSVVLVSGYSGIGKTALVEEIQRSVSEKRGYFIRGKFGQYLRDTPFSAITQAFRDLVTEILAEPEAGFLEWQDSLRSAVGSLGKVLTEVIPGLEKVLGPQPDIPQLEGPEAENRFNYVFVEFLLAVATTAHPLVLFIDDLQWIDAASFRLLKVIRSEFTQPGLLVVGAYRDNEVDASHPLMDVINDQIERGMPLRVLQLRGLQQQHLESLLSDTLSSREDIGLLAETLHERTQGNPFFFRRLLSTLNEEGRVRYDQKNTSWTWDIDDIRSEAIADNVVDFLAKHIEQLPEDMRYVLIDAACIGNRFDLPTLALISSYSEQEIVEFVAVARSRQYIFASGDAFEFVHDQVQQAAYALIDEDEKIQKHLEIGRLLLAGTDEPELAELIFDIVNQYNQGADLLTERSERLRLAELNLLAGRKSRAAAAFTASAEYLKQSVSLLDENEWQDNYRLTLDIHNELIEACFLSEQYEEVNTLFDTILDHVQNDVDAYVAIQTMITQKKSADELVESVSLADSYLERLHVPFDHALDSDHSGDELYDLPPMQDQEKLAAMGILATISTPVVLSASERFPSVVYTMLNLISRYGNNSISSFAYTQYAMILCLMQRYQEGNRFGQLAIDLLEKYPHPGRAAELLNMQYANVRPWMQSIHDQITPLKTHHRMAMQAGSFEFAFYCLLNYSLLGWGSGKPLEQILVEVEPSISLCQSKNQQFSLQLALMLAQSVLNLTGRSLSTTQLEGKWFSEETMMSRLEGNQFLLAFYGLLKMKLCYLFGNPGAAYRQTQDVLEYRGSLNPHYLYTKISFYGALACIAGLPDVESDADRQERIERLATFENELGSWADVAPMNYQHQYNLVMAEKSRVSDKHWEAAQLYEKAIRGAQENQFVQDEALANELFGRFWLDQGNDRIAEIYVREARALYSQWGASAKVDHLEDRYPHWFKVGIIPSGRPDTSGGVDNESTTITPSITSIQLDLDSVVSASRALSSETSLDRLLHTMLELVLSNSGAEKAVLLLKRGAEWTVQAVGDITSEKYDILVDQPFDPADSDDATKLVPEPVFDYCRRSGEVLVVGDARLDHRFANNRMVQIKDIKSMACVPCLTHGELEAMLYLENCLVTDVFTKDRVKILQLLSSQFCVSVVNALLYDSLTRKIQDLRESEERYQLAVTGSAAGIWDWDLRTNEVYYSDRAKKLLGYTPREFPNTLDAFWTRVHPDDYQLVRTSYEQHLEQNVPYVVEFRLQTKSGEYRWYHARGKALLDDSGKARRVSGSITDITERKQTEKALRDSTNKLLKAERIARMGFLTWNLKTNEIVWSREVYYLYGIDPQTPVTVEQTVGLVHPDDLEFVQKNLDGAIKGDLEYDIDHRMVRPDGKVVWVHARTDLERDSDGEPVSLLVSVVDITERKLAEEEARKHQESLARVDRTSRMGQLTGSIAHELNQPLTGILSNAQAAELLLESGQWDSDELAEIMAEIVSDTKRGGEMIRSLRELYRGQEIVSHPFDINAVIEESVRLLRGEFVIRNIEVTTKCALAIPIIDGNRIQIQQVLINLIMNGIQAMDGIAAEVRRLCVVTVHAGNEVKVWVDDCGTGVDAGKIDNIFEPLATWRSGGIGMGLAISDSIIQAHGGRMWAENRPEGGARIGFSLYVPQEGKQI